MTRVFFVNNYVEGDGGTLHIDGMATVNLTGQTHATDNHAGDDGGFAKVRANAVLQVTNGRFERNYVRGTATGNGRGGLVTAENHAALVFEGCSIIPQPSIFGGAFNIDLNSTLSLSSTTFSGMYADYGGCIAVYGNSLLQGSKCTINNCTAASNGGGLLFESRDASWNGGTFRNLRAGRGAAIYVRDATLSLADTTFLNGTATSGGAIFAEETAMVALKRCKMHGCTSLSDGGAMLVTGTAWVHLLDCEVSKCSSKASGGGALAAFVNTTVQLHRCSLHHNNAYTDGGAVELHLFAQVALTGAPLLTMHARHRVAVCLLTKTHLSNCMTALC